MILKQQSKHKARSQDGDDHPGRRVARLQWGLAGFSLSQAATCGKPGCAVAVT